MKHRYLMLVWLALAALAMLGAGRGSYEGGSYAGRAGSYVGGMVATWDTLTVLFTMDAGMDHYSDVYDADAAEALDPENVAKGGGVFELGTDLDFAHTGIRENDQDGNFNYAVARHGMALNTWIYGVSGQYIRLIRPDFADIFTCDGRYTVLEAKANYILNESTAYNGVEDTVCVSLIAPGNTAWYQPDNLLVNNPTFSYYASASWTWQKVRQDEIINPVFAPAGTSSDPWTFTDFDGYFWDIGTYHDMDSTVPDSLGYNGGPGATSYLNGNLWTVNFPVTAQAIFNGEENNGLAISGKAVNFARDNDFANWEKTGGQLQRPWIKLKLIRKRYSAPYPSGKRGVFLFSTDDQVAAANSIYADTIEAYGGTYTVYVRADAVGDAGRLSYSDLKGLYDRGHEIGSHSRWHKAGANLQSAGLNYWKAADGIVATDYTRGMDPSGLDSTTTSTQWDYLLADTDPVWLFEGLTAAGASLSEMVASGLVGKTIALPENTYNPAVLRAIDYHRYRAIRTGQIARVTRADTRFEWAQVAHRGDYDTPLVVAEADTAYAYRNQSEPGKPRNYLLSPTSVVVRTLVPEGAPTEKLVRRHTRGFLERVLATRHGVARVFTHDLQSSVIYPPGIDGDQLGWVLSVADSMGFWITSEAEYARHRDARLTPIGTPDAYPNEPKFARDRRVWFVPLGFEGQ